MPSEFSSNIQQIAREIKETDKKTAAAVRRAIRVAVAEAAAATNQAIKAAADGQGLNKARDATGVKVSFGVRSGGAVIRTDQRKAPYARPLEKGSKGSGGEYDRHPVFARGGLRPNQSGPLQNPSHFRNKGGYTVRYVNQPTRPYFYGTAKDMEPFDEAVFDNALGGALIAAGWTGVTRRTAQRASAKRQARAAAARYWARDARKRAARRAKWKTPVQHG